MQLEDVTSSRTVIRAGLALARVLPPRAGRAVADGIARLILARRPTLVKTVCGNLRQVLGPAANEVTLDEMTARQLRHAAMTYYDFFHAVGRSAAELAKVMPVPAATVDEIRSTSAAGRGVLILGMHQSNFDLALLSFGAHGLPVQGLSLADPPAGFRLLNELRTDAGFEITPISPASVRQAIRRLKRGGIVISAMDWPTPDDRTLVPFLGREAYLPLGPARLALLGNARVFLGACHYTTDFGYTIDVEGPLEMHRSGNRAADVYANMSRFAAFMEAQVRTYPEQWMMFHPFWPADAEK